MKDILFNFEDFISRKLTKENSKFEINDEYDSENNFELEEDKESLESQSDNQSDESSEEKEFLVEEEFEEEEEISHPKLDTSSKSDKLEESNYYLLYSDKSEVFSCDLFIEGANPNETIARLIVESEDWTLLFPGEIKGGKINIPIKKLNLFEEGQTGKIKLEVIAEGSVFIPWEDEFKIKKSKKVSVVLNERKGHIDRQEDKKTKV